MPARTPAHTHPRLQATPHLCPRPGLDPNPQPVPSSPLTPCSTLTYTMIPDYTPQSVTTRPSTCTPAAGCIPVLPGLRLNSYLHLSAACTLTLDPHPDCRLYPQLRLPSNTCQPASVYPLTPPALGPHADTSAVGHPRPPGSQPLLYTHPCTSSACTSKLPVQPVAPRSSAPRVCLACFPSNTGQHPTSTQARGVLTSPSPQPHALHLHSSPPSSVLTFVTYTSALPDTPRPQTAAFTSASPCTHTAHLPSCISPHPRVARKLPPASLPQRLPHPRSQPLCPAPHILGGGGRWAASAAAGPLQTSW